MANDDKRKALPEAVRNEEPGGNGIFPPSGRNIRRIRLDRSELQNVEAAPLWLGILEHTELIGFDRYRRFIDTVLCERWYNDEQHDPPDSGVAFRKLAGLDPYQLLRLATQVFLLNNVGAWRATPLADADSALDVMLGDRTIPGDDPHGDDQIGDRAARGVFLSTAEMSHVRDALTDLLGDDRSSYIDAIFPALQIERKSYKVSPFCFLGADPTLPCLLELIWSYWHEEGMLSQTLNAVGRRFQNVRRPGRAPDPLSELELAPLRPLSNFLWGYVNDEVNRLSVVRRAYEYQHHYGLSLYGKATDGIAPADARSRFIEAFHELLRRSALFYLQDDDTTVHADGFPILNALKEVHLQLAEGAHNQYRDLPWTARAEMLIEQWFMARSEMRDFLRGRWMMPYPELWMGGVDSMKRLQGWTDVSAIHFHDLGVFGERLLLSIRHYAWMNSNDHEDARTWARFWRPEVQGYIHAYRAATGVDLALLDTADITMPSVLLRRRLAEQHRTAGTLPPPQVPVPRALPEPAPSPAIGLPAARTNVRNR